MAKHRKTSVFLLVSIGEYQDIFPTFTCVKNTVAKLQPGIEFKYYVETNDRDRVLYVIMYYLRYSV
jgi:hypothetical protein